MAGYLRMRALLNDAKNLSPIVYSDTIVMQIVIAGGDCRGRPREIYGREVGLNPHNVRQ
jgi:hypothetical protein